MTEVFKAGQTWRDETAKRFNHGLNLAFTDFLYKQIYLDFDESNVDQSKFANVENPRAVGSAQRCAARILKKKFF